MECRINPKVSGNCLATAFNDSSGKSQFNLSANIEHDFSELVATVTIKTKDNGDKDFTIDLLKGNIDLCDIQSGFIGQIVLSAMGDNVKNHTNYDFKCPLKKGYYYLNNFPVSVSHLVPSFITAINREWRIDVTTRVKVSNSKRFVRVYSLQMRGSVSL